MDYICFYLLFYGALGLGLILRRWQAAAGYIMRSTILAVDTPILLYSYWILDLTQIRSFAPIPIIAACLVILTLWLSPWAAKRLLAAKTSQGSFVLSAAFSNIGTTGGSFICYLLFGLPGLSLGYLFLLPYPILIFTLGFSTAKQYACDCRLGFRDYLVNIITNLFALLPLIAMVLGLTLNLAGFVPPAGLTPLADIWIKLGLGLMCLAIGMTLRLRHVFTPIKPILFLAAIKFVIIPLIALVLVIALYSSLSPLPAKVILIQAMMPPAIYSVITANLFGLDRDLVNSLWFTATLFLIPIAGSLFLLLG